MGVYDKELIINGEAVRSPEQQVYKNMKDIETLKGKIKDTYKTSEALTSSSVSVAISDTNAPDGTTEGWLMTSDGLLFSITGGDETNLLLSYYADLKGPQGESGAAVNIDDSAVSLTKVWSSQKTYLETQIGNDKGIFYTTVAPVLSSGTTYDFDLDDVANATNTKKPKIKDLVIYIYNGVPSQVYEVLNDNSSVESLKLVGTYSQGKQLYQHNIRVSNGSSMTTLCIVIINDSATEINDSTKIYNWLYDNGYKATSSVISADTALWDKWYKQTFGLYGSYACLGVLANETTNDVYALYGGSKTAIDFTTWNNIDDDVREL